tara:strand:+ start:209 stop:934 length:726 start_codon:yes stop_codon:yes gene_type:complete
MPLDYMPYRDFDMSNLKQNGQLRWAPSYLRNRGQMTRGQKQAMRDWWPDYGILFQHDEAIDLDSCFGNDNPLIIEIGFGMGDHLVGLAAAIPNHRVLGIEVHRPGLAAAIQKIHEQALTNVRILRGDARLILTDHLTIETARAVIIQFPDPWPKPCDAHRRLVQTGLVEIIRQRLAPGGELLIVTDVEDYARHTEVILSTATGWEPVPRSSFHEHRSITPYEKKALEEGRQIHELSYRLIS